MTLTEMARISGMSESGLRRIEKSGKPVRESSLTLIVTALAAREPISEEDIVWLAQLSNHSEEFFAQINKAASRHRENARPSLPKAAQRAQDIAHRMQSALDSILASGAEVEAVELLEAIARWSIASRLAADGQPPEVPISTRERETIRGFKVIHPERTDPNLKNATVQDITHYESDGTNPPRQLNDSSSTNKPHLPEPKESKRSG